MSEESGTPFESGVDWLTVTALTPHSANRMEVRARRLLVQQSKLGEEEKPWAMSGFVGRMCGGVQVGFRGVDVLCRLTSETAHDNWKRLYEVADNCSRLDVQVTVRFEADVQPLVHKHYRQAKTFSGKMARGPKVSVYSSSDDSTTLYLGDRSSEKFGRCYNKAKESKLDHYRRCLRYEVEIKNDMARIAVNALAASEDHGAWCLAYVHGFFSGRGCRLNWPCAGTIRLCRPRSRSDIEKRLAWLAGDVRRSVTWLRERGYEREALSALGILTMDHEVRQGSEVTQFEEREM